MYVKMPLLKNSGDCVRKNPNAFQTLPSPPPKRAQPTAWDAGSHGPASIIQAFRWLITGAQLKYSQPTTAISSAERAVIDLTASRSPSPDDRPATAVTRVSSSAPLDSRDSQREDGSRVRNGANGHQNGAASSVEKNMSGQGVDEHNISLLSPPTDKRSGSTPRVSPTLARITLKLPTNISLPPSQLLPTVRVKQRHAPSDEATPRE
jgi:hypothetical protein